MLDLEDAIADNAAQDADESVSGASADASVLAFVNEQMSSMNQTIAGIQVDLISNGVQDQIESNAGDNADNELQSDIDTNTLNISDLDSEVDQDRLDRDAIDAQIQASIDANKIDSDNGDAVLQSQLDELQTDVFANTANVATNTSGVVTNAASVVDLQTQINDLNTANNTAAIASVHDDVDANEIDSDNADAFMQSQIDVVLVVSTNETASDAADNGLLDLITSLQSLDALEVQMLAGNAQLQEDIDANQESLETSVNILINLINAYASTLLITILQLRQWMEHLQVNLIIGMVEIGCR